MGSPKIPVAATNLPGSSRLPGTYIADAKRLREGLQVSVAAA